MSQDNFVYIFLNLFLLLIFFIAGHNISKGGKYSLNSILCIIVYSIILGLRYGRGDDYFHYQEIYLKGYDEESQIIFLLINDILKTVGINEYGFFGIYNFIEMLCGLFFLGQYRKYSQYLFPLFLIATLGLNENTIRQGLGYGFVFLSLSKIVSIEYFRITDLGLYKKELISALLYFFLAYSIHSMCGYIMILMVVIHFFIKKPIPLFISIPVLIFSAYYFSTWFDFSWLNPVIAQVSGEDDLLSSYANNSDYWFSEEGMNTDLYERKPLILLGEMLGTISLFYTGRKMISKHRIKGFVSFYNYYVVGSLILNAFRSLEILNRIGSSFSLFWFFPLTIVIYYRKELKSNRMATIASYMLIWFIYDYFKYIFLRGDNIRFVWDTI